MNFQLKPESEFTIQGYLYLMEKSKKSFLHQSFFSFYFPVLFVLSCRSLHGNMAEILLHVQETKQTVYHASIQSTDSWTNCKYK